MRKLTDDDACESCGWETRLDVYRRGVGAVEREREEIILCSVCANGPAGNAVQYPAQYPSRDVLWQIAVGTNLILDKLEETDERRA